MADSEEELEGGGDGGGWWMRKWGSRGRRAGSLACAMDISGGGERVRGGAGGRGLTWEDVSDAGEGDGGTRHWGGWRERGQRGIYTGRVRRAKTRGPSEDPARWWQSPWSPQILGFAGQNIK